MTITDEIKDEVKKYLKENLRINVVTDYCNKNINITLFLEDEIISESNDSLVYSHEHDSDG
jgi:hypothetical protein